ncbi:hypothetical protein D5085_02690 [Ectothiorhodospiraceae bacterium BW-2]|nr:hypothetical protein D5085_02690 [Ectothiorhodospiraceae bacterium BW-2]
MTHSIRLYGYGLTIFLSSAALMILEIVAARLLAPYVGVSLYTWTTLIGVILAGLALGNWIGGVWADRAAGVREAGLTLGLSGLLSLATLLLLTWLAPRLQQQPLSLIAAAFLYVGTLFFLPALLLGIITPLLTTLSLRLSSQTGHILGAMHALAALGSITGTFAAGYWLVQYFGTRALLIATSAALLLLSLPFLHRAHKTLLSLLLLLLFIVGLTEWRDGYANPCDRESSYFCIRVVDEPLPPGLGTARGMILDHLAHGTNHRQDPTLLLAPYVQLMDELVTYHFPAAQRATMRWFFAGGGAYTLPRAVSATEPLAEIYVAELDPQVTQVAIEKMDLDPRAMHIEHSDARLALLRHPNDHFSVIIGDVFHDIAIPYHLITKEFFELVKTKLTPDGLYLMNVVDAFPDPRLVKSLLNTLSSQFRYLDVWLDEIPAQPQRMTYVISASLGHAAPDTLQAQRGFNRQWLNITEPLQQSATPLTSLPRLRDNYAPVDRLLSDLWFGDLGV